MKRLILLAAVAIVPLMTAKTTAAVSLPTGPVSFKLTALMQQADATTLKTNKTATSTNITSTVKSTVASKTVVNKDFLNLLANSFTNLPATITNGQLVADGNGNFFVVTSTSTNDVTSVLKIDADNAAFAGSETIVTKSPPGTKISEIEKATATQTATLTYDDSALTTGNGKHTLITYHGLMVTQFGDATTKFTTSFTFTGQGDGIVENKFIVFSGTITGSTSGSVDLDD